MRWNREVDRAVVTMCLFCAQKVECERQHSDHYHRTDTALFAIISDTGDTFNFIVARMYTQLFNLLGDKEKTTLKEMSELLGKKPYCYKQYCTI